MIIEVLNPSCQPVVGSAGAAGIDLRGWYEGVPPAYLLPGTKYVMGTGVKMNIPKGWVGLVMPRSGLGFKYEVMLANSVGVIDSDYEGEIKVALVVRGIEPMPFTNFDRVCQMVVVPHYDYSNITFGTIVKESERGEGGLGHSGIK